MKSILAGLVFLSVCALTVSAAQHEETGVGTTRIDIEEFEIK